MWPQPPPYPWPNMPTATAASGGVVISPAMPPPQYWQQSYAMANAGYGIPPGYMNGGNSYISHATRTAGDDVLAEQAASWAQMRVQMEHHQQEQFQRHAAVMMAMNAAMPPALPPSAYVADTGLSNNGYSQAFPPPPPDETPRDEIDESFTPPPAALVASITENEVKNTFSTLSDQSETENFLANQTDMLLDDSLMPASALLASAAALEHPQPTYTSIILQAAAATAAASMQLTQPNAAARGLSRVVPPWLREGIEKRQKEKQKEREKLRELSNAAATPAATTPTEKLSAVSKFSFDDKIEDDADGNPDHVSSDVRAEIEDDYAKTMMLYKNAPAAKYSSLIVGSSVSSGVSAAGDERKKIRVSRFSDAFSKSVSTTTMPINSLILDRVAEKQEAMHAAGFGSPATSPVSKISGKWKTIGDDDAESKRAARVLVTPTTRRQPSATPSDGGSESGESKSNQQLDSGKKSIENEERASLTSRRRPSTQSQKSHTGTADPRKRNEARELSNASNFSLAELFGENFSGNRLLPREQLDTAVAYKVRTIVTTLLMSITQKRTEAVCCRVVAAAARDKRKSSLKSDSVNYTRHDHRRHADDQCERDEEKFRRGKKSKDAFASKSQRSNTKTSASVQPPPAVQSNLVKNLLGVYGGDDDDDESEGDADTVIKRNRSSTDVDDNKPLPSKTSRWDSKTKIKLPPVADDDDNDGRRRSREKHDHAKRLTTNSSNKNGKRRHDSRPSSSSEIASSKQKHGRSATHSRSNTAEQQADEEIEKPQSDRRSTRHRSRNRSPSSPARKERRRSNREPEQSSKTSKRRYGDHDDRTDASTSPASDRREKYENDYVDKSRKRRKDDRRMEVDDADKNRMHSDKSSVDRSALRSSRRHRSNKKSEPSRSSSFSSPR